jgi:hypothetical protein
MLGILACLICLSAPVALADEDGALTLINVDTVFVPKGFDDNDEVVAVVDGYLPDSCYKVAYNEVHYLAEEQKYVIFQFARKYNALCLDVRVPFFAEARFGVLPMGEFKVQAPGALTERLNVAEATNAGPDDRLYAPVDTVHVRELVGGSQEAIINGRFTNSCMSLDGVAIINSGKTLEVLPQMYMQDRDDCVVEEIPFSWSFALPATTTESRRLLHVRSLNGKAVNLVFGQPSPAH